MQRKPNLLRPEYHARTLRREMLELPFEQWSVFQKMVKVTHR